VVKRVAKKAPAVKKAVATKVVKAAIAKKPSVKKAVAKKLVKTVVKRVPKTKAAILEEAEELLEDVVELIQKSKSPSKSPRRR
jgi:hypothetical protein